MIIKLIKNIKVCFFILFLMGGVFFAGEARGDILSVTFYSINFNNSIPVGDPRNYIKFGGNDTIIEVDVRTDDTGWGIITSVSVTIPTDGVDIVMSINPGGLGPVGPATAVGGGTFTANITDLGPNSEYQNFRVSFTYTPDNTISESIVTARNIEAAAVSTNSPPATTDNQNYGVSKAGITSITVTPAARTGVDSRYYLAGTNYDFDIHVEANGHSWDCVNEVTLVIPTESAGNLEFTINPNNLTVSGSGAATGTVSASISGDWNDFIVTFSWNPTAVAGGSTIDSVATDRVITGRAVSALLVGDVIPNPPPVATDYGIATAGIRSVTLIADDGTLVGGREYYIAGGSYNFVVDVDVNGHSWDCVTGLTLIIPRTAGADLEFTINPDGSDSFVLDTISGERVNYTYSGADFSNNFTVTFSYQPSDKTATEGDTNVDSPAPLAAHNIIASATSLLFAGTVSDNVSKQIGIATDGIKTINLTIPDGTSDGANEYYRAGTNYNFDVVITANGHSWNCITSLTLNIPREFGDDLVFVIPAPNGITGGPIADSGGSGAVINYSYPILGTPSYNSFTVRFALNLAAGLAGINSIHASRSITASATSAIVGGTETHAPDKDYGISTGIDSITVSVVTGANTTQVASQPYFLPSTQYIFDVAVVANGHTFTDITNITLTIPGTPTPITLSADPDYNGGTPPVTVTGVNTVVGGVTGTSLITGSASNFTMRFIYTPNWSNWGADDVLVVEERNISATAASFGGPLLNETAPHTYGTCTRAKIISLSQDGNAVDGLVNPWDAGFIISGVIVYNVSSATIADTINSDLISANPRLGYSLNTGIYKDTNGIPISDANTDSNLSFTVPDNWFSANLEANDGIGQYEWQVRTTFSGVDHILIPETPLTLICDKFQVVDVRFQNGGGLDNPPDYHRNIYTAGTQIQVLAQMQYGGGNTTVDAYIDVEYNYGGGVQTTTVIIPAGTNGSAVWYEIKNPTSVDVPTGTTLGPFSDYFITSVTGAGGIFGGDGQNVAGRFTHTGYTPPSIHWDNADPPGDDGSNMFTPWASTTSTVDAITLNWTPLDAVANPVFSTYRIYYRPVLAAPLVAAWSMIDRDTDPPTTNSLGQISTGTYTITDLQSITEYEYYLTAIDIYGNETFAANRAHGGIAGDPSHTVTTAAYGLEISVTDGITLYDNTAMENDNTNPAIRPLLATSIRFEVDISGADQPGEINVIIANTTADGFDSNPPNDGVFDLHPDIENEVSASWDKPAAPDGFFRIPISKVAPNKWAGHISSENPLIVPANNCKFILEVLQGTTPSYYGFDPDQNMNDVQWTFSIIDPPKVTPWPTRILNNVITSKNPVAYPAYYLTDDAYVTIIAYDIKGRPVATLLDNAFRRSGQNIREQGWRGTNKAGRKLGVGLYYVHIKAKRVSDGKTIINKFEKVVMAR